MTEHGACDGSCAHGTPEDRQTRAAFGFYATLHEKELHEFAKRPLSCSGYRRLVEMLLALPKEGDRLFLGGVLRRLFKIEEEKKIHTAIVEKIEAAMTAEAVERPGKPEVTH